MRTILVILAILLFTGWLLCEIEITSAEGTVVVQTDSSAWRRTADGWEQMEDWKPISSPSADLHPGIVGLFILFISVFSLVGFEAPAPMRRHH